MPPPLLAPSASSPRRQQEEGAVGTRNKGGRRRKGAQGWLAAGRHDPSGVGAAAAEQRWPAIDTARSYLLAALITPTRPRKPQVGCHRDGRVEGELRKD